MRRYKGYSEPPELPFLHLALVIGREKSQKKRFLSFQTGEKVLVLGNIGNCLVDPLKR